ncbi:hypothetical protein C7974DRAFT_123546 [Boeremia exigua]|uniref:uncharacterized protein n=1 Tax=Boeremia exigua TaxID=749465 RepID=UPI001E8E0C46|nr:uncharacterized protein C7974DRAFT_123546 [Boeremia exigua]KAH6638926.1 hypothetical protein C7974DRAFT_123546 [Boeremia exigua]
MQPERATEHTTASSGRAVAPSTPVRLILKMSIHSAPHRLVRKPSPRVRQLLPPTARLEGLIQVQRSFLHVWKVQWWIKSKLGKSRLHLIHLYQDTARFNIRASRGEVPSGLQLIESVLGVRYVPLPGFDIESLRAEKGALCTYHASSRELPRTVLLPGNNIVTLPCSERVLLVCVTAAASARVAPRPADTVCTVRMVVPPLYRQGPVH